MYLCNIKLRQEGHEEKCLETNFIWLTMFREFAQARFTGFYQVWFATWPLEITSNVFKPSCFFCSKQWTQGNHKETRSVFPGSWTIQNQIEVITARTSTPSTGTETVETIIFAVGATSFSKCQKNSNKCKLFKVFRYIHEKSWNFMIKSLSQFAQGIVTKALNTSGQGGDFVNGNGTGGDTGHWSLKVRGDVRQR